jgi:hypothetical protein
MSKCKIRWLNSEGQFITFTCDEIRKKHYEMKKEFREKNGTDKLISLGMTDRIYVEYCKQLDDFMNQCKCTDGRISLKCEKCPEEDHDRYFCRCEDRNIQLSRQLRADKVTIWSKDIATKS